MCGAKRHGAGFTLIEVLVVLLIVSIMISGAGLALDAVRRNDADGAIERLRRTLEASAERALMQGRPVAIEIMPDGYRFFAPDSNGRWWPFESPPLQVAGTLPASIRAEGIRFPADASATAPAGLQRRLVLGTRPPRYELVLDTARGRVILAGDPTGRVRRLSSEAQP